MYYTGRYVMAPKKQFTKEQLADIAFQIACEEGFENITIRKIAERLGCSIAPIYVNYKDVAEVKHDVVLKAIDISKELISQQSSGDPFLDIGIASVLFAKKYPMLFDELVIKNKDSNTELMDTSEFVLQQMKMDSDLKEFDDTQLRLLLIKMQALQAGLSLLARKEEYSSILTDDVIIKILDETGVDVMNGMMSRRNKDI